MRGMAWREVVGWIDVGNASRDLDGLRQQVCRIPGVADPTTKCCLCYFGLEAGHGRIAGGFLACAR